MEEQRLTFVADGSVGPNGGLLHLRALVLCDEGRGNGEARNAVLLWQVETELLSVVVDLLNALKLQADESLVAASEGLGGGCAGGLGNGLLLILGKRCASSSVQVVVSSGTGSSGNTAEEEGI